MHRARISPRFQSFRSSKKQLNALKGISINWKLVKENSLENGDKVKFRYLIDYDLIGIDKMRSSVIYLQYTFITSYAFLNPNSPALLKSLQAFLLFSRYK